MNKEENSVMDGLRRIKAVFTPQVIALLGLALALFGFSCFTIQEKNQSLEVRASKVLSQVEGAGKVEVAIVVRKSDTTDTGLLSRKSGREAEIPCGAIAVAQGADDPIVRMQLEQALCALLGLPISAVSVVTGGK